MCVWFSQTVKGSGQVRLIDYYEASGEGFPHFVQVLREKRYTYGTHWAPHDIAVRELGSGKSRLEVAAALGLRFSVTPRLSSAAGQELEDGIHCGAAVLPALLVRPDALPAGARGARAVSAGLQRAARRVQGDAGA